jgi:crossover junction endodeoxyribonuclease RuvC
VSVLYTRKVFIGIDPGSAGGIAVIADDGMVHAYPMPYDNKEYDLNRMRYLLEPEGGERYFAVVEKVHSMPKQGLASTFAFGKGFGILLGMLGAFRIPYTLVTPQAWQKVMLAGEPKDGKAASIRVARRLFPGVSLRPTERCKVDNDGMAEALLLAEYGRMTGATT